MILNSCIQPQSLISIKNNGEMRMSDRNGFKLLKVVNRIGRLEYYRLI